MIIAQYAHKLNGFSENPNIKLINMWRVLCVIVAFSIPISYIPSTRIPPSQRAYSVMDYSKLQDSLLLFSGLDADGYSNDLWTFLINQNYWNEINPSSEDKPGIS